LPRLRELGQTAVTYRVRAGSDRLWAVLKMTYCVGMPDPQTVYRDDQGRVLIYVRTEKRSGRKEPEHLFVTTRERTVFQLWRTTLPDEAELVLDVEGRKEADQVRWLLHVAEHERNVVLGLLKQACKWLPAERAADLRGLYAASRP